jgi:outer membrane protein insertion porin family
LNEVEDGQIPIEILVKELPWWSVRTGIGYGLEERFRLSLRIKKLGWLGGARRAEFTIRHSFLEPYHFSLNMIQPAFFTPQASLKLNPYLKREREDAYELESMGLSTTFQRELSGYTTTFISYQFERADLEMKTDVDSYYEELSRENYNKSSVSMGLSIDHSEPAFTPDRGWQGSVVTTLSGLKLGSEYHYWQWLIDLRKYYQVLNGTVMAGRAKLGQMKPLWGDEITPIEERFYAGGSTSLRGWNRGGVGPKNEADIAVGGESYLEFSLELRQHIWKQLYGVIFVDAGNVWSDYNSQNLTDLFYSPGLGIRYETPIGPVRFDAAQPLTGSKKQTMLHLSIGQAF